MGLAMSPSGLVYTLGSKIVFFSLRSRLVPPVEFHSTPYQRSKRYGPISGHAVLARLKTACLLFGHAVCFQNLDRLSANLSDFWDLIALGRRVVRFIIAW